MYSGDRIVNDVPPKNRDIAMVFQSYALYPHMTVYKNMAFALDLRKTPKDEIDTRVRHAAKVLDIEHLLERKPKALSGGQRQRVALGRAMVRNPAVFLLDEPLSNLDAKLRASMRTELIKLHKQLGTTFVYVTHDQTEAMTMGDRIVVMSNGVVQQVDTPQNLYDFPRNVFVAGFIGSPQMNFIDVTLGEDGQGFYLEMKGESEERLYIPAAKAKEALKAYAGRPVRLGIRPEDIYDDEAYIAANTGSAIRATVDVTEMMGAEVYLYLKCGDSVLNARVAPTTTSKAGDKVMAALNMNKIHLFDPESEEAILN
jgi:multiple sugar transport system ATP-binding protein